MPFLLFLLWVVLENQVKMGVPPHAHNLVLFCSILVLSFPLRMTVSSVVAGLEKQVKMGVPPISRNMHFLLGNVCQLLFWLSCAGFVWFGCPLPWLDRSACLGVGGGWGFFLPCFGCGVGGRGAWRGWLVGFVPVPGTCDEGSAQRAEGHRTIWYVDSLVFCFYAGARDLRRKRRFVG